MELVKLVMEIYYKLIRLQELEENNFPEKNENEVNSHKENNITNNTNNATNNSTSSPSAVYYTTHHNSNSDMRPNSRTFNSTQQPQHQHNDTIYMNNSSLSVSFSETKQKKTSSSIINENTDTSPNNTHDINNTMKQMKNLNLNNHYKSNDYINKLIYELNKNSNRKG